ncbi:unnamed protein product, partial [Hymenolepis diminuta]
ADEESKQFPDNIRLPIGIDGISSLCFIPSIDRKILVVGTTGGRIRLLDCSTSTAETLYQKCWHKNIRCLSVSPFSPSMCITASKQACIKVHDLETKQRICYYTPTEHSSPYSALITVADHRFITGDDNGLVKIWDDRLQGGHCFTIKPDMEEMDVDLLGINDLAVGRDSQATLLAAVDSGCLVTYNIRRRRQELVSEPLGFSARSVCVVKDGRKVLLGTDEGLVMTYNWGEFGSNCDRFPVRTSRTRVDYRSGSKFYDDVGCPSVEKIVKFSEDIVIIATDDGAISPVHILPNQMFNCLGWHTAEGVSGIDAVGGDCMTLALSPGDDPSEMILASGLPLTSSIKFWPLLHVAEETQSHLEEPTRKSASGRSTKAKVTSIGADQERRSFLSGLTDVNGSNQNGGEDDSNSDADSDSS